MDNKAKVKPVSELTNSEDNQMFSKYRTIADMDDVEYTTKQKQLRVKKMMLGQGKMEMILSLVNPVLHQQAVKIELRADMWIQIDL